MERLTEYIEPMLSKYDDGIKIKNDDYAAAEQKLAYYEDLEEQDLLLCSELQIGKTVFYISEDEETPWEMLIDCIKFYDYGVNYHAKEKFNTGTIEFSEEDMGITIFLTKSEAEQKLKELMV